MLTVRNVFNNREIGETLLQHHARIEGQAEVVRQLEAQGILEQGAAKVKIEALRKGPVTAGDLASITPQDIEPDAMPQLWQFSDPDELILEKILPSTPASQVQHTFTRVDGYSEDGVSGFFAENTVPAATKGQYGQDATYIKLHGRSAQVGPLAGLTRTVNVLGSSNAVDQSERLALLSNYRQMNRNRYFADSRGWVGGEVNGIAFRGLKEIIEVDAPAENTVDMLGGNFDFSNVRDGALHSWENFVQFNLLIMGGRTCSKLEQQLDTAIRINRDPAPGIGAVMWGNKVAGMNVNGKDVIFLRDRILAPMHGKPKYSASRPDVRPSSLPTVVACAAQADNATGDTVASKWDANARGAGQVFYAFTFIQNGVQSLGVRFPTGTSTFAVAVGEEVRIVLDHPTDAQSIVVYRGYPSVASGDGGGLASTDAWEIFQIAADPSGRTTFYDNNLNRPNTECAFGLTVQGKAQQMITSGPDGYQMAQNSLSEFVEDQGGPMNSVSRVHLGPALNRIELPKFLMQAGNTAFYSATAMQCRRLRTEMLFKNIIPG